MKTKETPTKNQLIPLRVKTVSKPVKKGDLPVLTVEGDYPSRYNEASAIKKAAEGLMDELRPLLLPDAIAEIYRHNNERPWDAISSVKLQDDDESVLRVTFMAKYSVVGASVAESFFDQIKMRDGSKPNINNYLARAMQASFDSSVFLGPDGKFDEKRYAKFVAAVEKVAKELGTTNPLSAQEVVTPLPDFHSRRWLDFDVKTNQQISEVIKNQTNLTPQPKAAKQD